jgi:hypothetical protein
MMGKSSQRRDDWYMEDKKDWTSKIVQACQSCNGIELKPLLFLGYLPPVNQYLLIGTKPNEQPSYPAQLLMCNTCKLVQLGLVVNPKILFPKEYPYTSSTTKILRENFAELHSECEKLIALHKDDLIIDIGSNDGNLLSNFKEKHRVLGITPEDIGKIAIERGIPTILDYFKDEVVSRVLKEHGKAKIITATNVFAHIDNPNHITELILKLLDGKGVFISESHYLLPLIETLQYDTVYHEHLRYYSLHSLMYLLEKHGFEVFHAKQIPTHGGSIRVYAARKGEYQINKTVGDMLLKEQKTILDKKKLVAFGEQVMLSKLELHALLLKIKSKGTRIVGISAPSRAGTLINYTGLDDSIIDSILEIKGSHKIGKYMPGTLIPIMDEALLYQEQPEYALLLSWHIADELVANLRKKGYRGKFIVPLPKPHVVE